MGCPKMASVGELKGRNIPFISSSAIIMCNVVENRNTSFANVRSQSLRQYPAGSQLQALLEAEEKAGYNTNKQRPWQLVGFKVKALQKPKVQTCAPCRKCRIYKFDIESIPDEDKTWSDPANKTDYSPLCCSEDEFEIESRLHQIGDTLRRA